MLAMYPIGRRTLVNVPASLVDPELLHAERTSAIPKAIKTILRNIEFSLSIYRCEERFCDEAIPSFEGDCFGRCPRNDIKFFPAISKATTCPIKFLSRNFCKPLGRGANSFFLDGESLIWFKKSFKPFSRLACGIKRSISPTFKASFLRCPLIF